MQSLEAIRSARQQQPLYLAMTREAEQRLATTGEELYVSNPSDRPTVISSPLGKPDSSVSTNAKDMLAHAIKWYGYDHILQAMQELIEEHQRGNETDSTS